MLTRNPVTCCGTFVSVITSVSVENHINKLRSVSSCLGMTSDGGLLQTQFIRYFKSETNIYKV